MEWETSVHLNFEKDEEREPKLKEFELLAEY